MAEEHKPEELYEDVYVATLTKDNRVILQGRNYETMAEVPVEEIAGFLLAGVCVCQRQKDWFGQPLKPSIESESYWFCLDAKTGKRAIAEVWSLKDKKQVVMRQPGSSCEI